MSPTLWPTLNSYFLWNFGSQMQKSSNTPAWFLLYSSYFWIILIVVDANSWGWTFESKKGHTFPLSVIPVQLDVLSRVHCFITGVTLRVCQGELRVIQKQKEGLSTSQNSVNKCKSLANTASRAHIANSSWNPAQTFSLRPSMMQSITSAH